MASSAALSSFSSVRSFVETMKTLGYPDFISMESFRTPNFHRVASCIRWLLKRYDPSIELDVETSTDDQRVAFLKSASQLLFSRTRIQWDLKNLYSSDAAAVDELHKLASLLLKSSLLASSADKCADADTTLFKKAFDVKAARSLVLDIIKAGATLYDDLAQESQLQVSRWTATSTNTDIEQIENMVREATDGLLQPVKSVEQQLHSCEKDEKSLSATLEKRKVELERCKKRLSVLQNVRPAYVDEYEALQKDLQRLFSIYLEKFHNLQWLESQLESHKQEEQEKLEESYSLMRKLQQHLHDENMRIMRGEEVGNFELMDSQSIASFLNSSQPRPLKGLQDEIEEGSKSGSECNPVENEEANSDDDF